VKFTVL